MNYDKTSATSIFNYSKLLLGHCLRDYAPEDTEEYSGKGGLGQLVEKVFFEYEPNNVAKKKTIALFRPVRGGFFPTRMDILFSVVLRCFQ